MMENDDIQVIRLMLAKGREKLKTAWINYDNERYEDAVSHAYYAVFHTISAVLMSKKIHASSHKQTIGSFNKEFVKTGVFPGAFTRTIQKLFLERQSSDYDFSGSIGLDIAEEDMKEVEKIINTCEQYLSQFYHVPKEYWRD